MVHLGTWYQHTETYFSLLVHVGRNIIRSQHGGSNWACSKARKQRQTYCGKTGASYPSVFSAHRIKFLIVCSICTRFEFLACVVNCETSWLFIILLLVCWIFRLFTQVSGSDTCHLSCLKSWGRKPKTCNRSQSTKALEVLQGSPCVNCETSCINVLSWCRLQQT